MVGLMFPALGTSYSFSSAFTFFPRFHTIPAHSPYPRAFPLFPRFHIFPALFHSRAFSLSPRFHLISALSSRCHLIPAPSRAFTLSPRYPIIPTLSPYPRALPLFPRFHLIPALSHYSRARHHPPFHMVSFFAFFLVLDVFYIFFKGIHLTRYSCRRYECFWDNFVFFVRSLEYIA